MPIGQGTNPLQRRVIYAAMLANGPQCAFIWRAAVLANAAQQSVSHLAKGSATPTGIFLTRISLLPLQYPLQRISHDPPPLVELGYEAIGGGRWALNRLPAIFVCLQRQRAFAHPFSGRRRLTGRSLRRCLRLSDKQVVPARTGGEHITTFRGHTP
jgi:hypothetical protein